MLLKHSFVVRMLYEYRNFIIQFKVNKMGNSTSVKIVFRKSSKNPNVGNLHLRVINNRKSKFKSLGIEVPKKYWDKDNQRVLPSLKGTYKHYNKIIVDTLKEVNSNYNDIKVLDVVNTDVIEYWNEHNEGTINAGTKQLRNASFKKFKKFLATKKIKGLEFRQITPQLVEQFEAYLSQTLEPRSINTYLGFFKAIVNKAISHQIIHYRVHPFLHHKNITNKNKKARSLTIEQIKQIIEVELTPDLNYYRNMFVFQIMGGGMRVKDLITLKWSNLHVNENGVYLNYKQYKGGKVGKEINSKLSFKALSFLNPLMSEIEPKKISSINFLHEMLNSQLVLKSKLESNIKFADFNVETIKDYKHYDHKEQRYYHFDEAKTDAVQLLTLEQNIEMYTSDLIHEYGEVINIIKRKQNGYIFEDLMQGLVLPPNNTNLKIDYLVKYRITKYNKGLKAIADKLNIDKFTSHNARHSFTQLLVNSNTNLFYIMQLLGHSSLTITQNYVRTLDSTELDKVSDTLAAQF